MKNNRCNQRTGAVLVAALVCLLIVTAMVGTMLQGTLRARRHLHVQRDLRQIELLLQAGVDRAATRLSQEADYRGETWQVPSTAFAGRSAAQVAIKISRDADDDPWEVRVVAEYPTAAATMIRRSRVFYISSPTIPVQE